MDPINYLRVAGGRWRIIVVTGLVGLLAGWITTPGAEQTDPDGSMVSATHTLRLEAGTQDARGGAESGPSLEVTALFVEAGPVPERAAAALGGDPEMLKNRVQAITDPRVGTVTIVGTDADPERAAEIANTFARELLAVLSEEAQERYGIELEASQGLVDDVQAQLDALPPPSEGQDAQRNVLTRGFDEANSRLQLLQQQGVPTAGLTTLEEASADEVVPASSIVAPTGATDRRTEGSQATATPAADGAAVARVRPPEDPPNRGVRMLLGGGVGLLLGVGLALLRERFDTRIRSKEGAEQAFGLFVLAEIPRLGRRRRSCQIASTGNGRELEAEAYRVLRTALLFHRTAVATIALGAAGPRLGNGTDRIETTDDLVQACRGVPVLGVVPSLPDTSDLLSRHLSSGTDAAAPLLEAVRALHAPLQPGRVSGVRTLQITSATPGEGKTTTAAHVAIGLARSGLRVSLVDCDLQRPTLHQLFGLSNSVGLTSVVAGEASVSVACRPVPEVERLSVLPSGSPPPHPSQLLASPRLAEVLASLTLQSDLVVLDGPAALPGSDAHVLAERVDATVLVARRGVTSATELRRSVDALGSSGGRLAGTVFDQGDDERPPPASATDRNLQVLLVTSPGNNEGKTSTVANLSAAFAETGPTVLALDFDLRRPQLHEFFATERSPGLTDVLELPGQVPMLPEVIRPTPVPQIRVATSGPPTTNLSGLLPRGRQLVDEARHHADLVMIDTPPVLAASDASQLIPAADGVVIVCRAGATTTEGAARCAEQMARMGAPVLGVVLIGTPLSPVARAYASRSRADGKAKGRGSEQPRPSKPGFATPKEPTTVSSPPFRTSANGGTKKRVRGKDSKRAKQRS